MNEVEFVEACYLGIVLGQPGRRAVWLTPGQFSSPRHQRIAGAIDDLIRVAEQRVNWSISEGEIALRSLGIEGTAPPHQPTPSEADLARDNAAHLLSEVGALIAEEEYPDDVLERIARGETDGVIDAVDIDYIRARADMLADAIYRFPGLQRRLDERQRAFLDRLLPLSPTDPYQINGVGPIGVLRHLVSTRVLGEDVDHLALYLHAVIAMAPAKQTAPPELYAKLISEEAIRRDLAESGIRVSQRLHSAELHAILDEVATAASRADESLSRWAWITRQHVEFDHESIMGEDLDDVDSFDLRVPDDEHLQAAEERLAATVASDRRWLDQLGETLTAEDFADPHAAGTFRAAKALADRDEPVEPALVVYEQLRNASQGLHPDRIATLTSTGISTDPLYDAELVMLGRLSRLSSAAADQVTSLARRRDLPLEQVLGASSRTYLEVGATATRMSEPIRTAAQFAGLSHPVALADALTSGQATAAASQPLTDAATARSPTAISKPQARSGAERG